jgi:hypothetical protein
VLRGPGRAVVDLVELLDADGRDRLSRYAAEGLAEG